VPYSTLLNQPVDKYTIDDFISAVLPGGPSSTEQHWKGSIPSTDGEFWTPAGRFPNEYIEEDPAGWAASTSVVDSEVSSLPCHIMEIDEGTFEDQGALLGRVVAEGLPRPTAVVISGDPRIPGATPGKSLHLFWVLDVAYTRSEVPEWKRVQEALIEALGGDPNIKNPARKMRFGGEVSGGRHQTILHIEKQGVVSKEDMRTWADSVVPERSAINGSVFSGIGAASSSPREAVHPIEGGLTVSDGSREFTIQEWYNSVEIGAHQDICCVEAGSTTVGSAFLVKEEWGVRLTCNAGHHGHEHEGERGRSRWEWRSQIIFRRGDETEVAERVIDVDFGRANLKFSREKQYIFNEEIGTWTEDGTLGVGRLLTRLVSYAGNPVTAGQGTVPLRMGRSFVGGATGLIQALTADPNYFDDTPHGVASENGLVLPDGSLVSLEREHRVRDVDVFPVSYNPSAPHVRWTQFLEEIFAGDVDAVDKASLLQEFIGCCLFGRATFYQRHLILYGPHGSNGKSVLLKVIKSLFPSSTISSVPMQDWPKSFGLSWVPGTRLNVVTEMPERDLLDSGPVKAILTGDIRAIEEKYKASYSVIPLAGHLLAANKMPYIADDTRAFFRRFMVLSFNQIFEGPKKDPFLESKLLTEREGIFRWAVEGFQRLVFRGDYAPPESSEDLLDEWALYSDSTKAFVEETLVRVEDPTRGSNGDALYSVYREWCQDVGSKPVRMRRFTAGLSRAGGQVRRPRRDGKRIRLWDYAIKSREDLPRRARIAVQGSREGITVASDDSAVLDTATRYVQEKVDENMDSRMTTTEIFSEYSDWCGEIGEEVVGTTATLGKILKREGLLFTRFKKDGKTHRGWQVST
jgi:P4 family phage/plasmid primase-like protien